jgi:hypothetical protein
MLHATASLGREPVRARYERQSANTFRVACGQSNGNQAAIGDANQIDWPLSEMQEGGGELIGDHVCRRIQGWAWVISQKQEAHARWQHTRGSPCISHKAISI